MSPLWVSYRSMTSRFPPFAFVELVSPYNKKNITRWLEDMNFMFEWQEQYLTSERSERVRYCSCHENIKFISSSHRVISSIYGQCERSESTFSSFLNRYIKWPKNFLAFNAKCIYYCPTDFIYIALIGNTTNKTFSQWNLRALPLVTHHVKSESVVNIFALQQRIFV